MEYKSVAELKKLARKQGIPNYSKLRKAQLVVALSSPSNGKVSDYDVLCRRLKTLPFEIAKYGVERAIELNELKKGFEE